MRKEQITAGIASDWRNHPYYDKAEAAAAFFWRPASPYGYLFAKLDLACVLELACGHGRHLPHYRGRAGIVHLVDVNAENIAFCRERFADEQEVHFHVNDGATLPDVADESLTALFTYDSMVHFDIGDIASYLEETRRVLKPGGRALFHHSNNDRNPGAWYSENVHARNYMSAGLFRHLAIRAGLTCIEQLVTDWGGGPNRAFGIDCLTLCEKPRPEAG
jgi:SAM-dependent methyltransferase